MSRRAIWVSLTAAHLALTAMALSTAMGLALVFFDGGSNPVTAKVALGVSRGLMFPIAWPFALHLPLGAPFVGYVPFILNSALWGWLMTLVYDRLPQRRRRI